MCVCVCNESKKMTNNKCLKQGEGIFTNVIKKDYVVRKKSIRLKVFTYRQKERQ